MLRTEGPHFNQPLAQQHAEHFLEELEHFFGQQIDNLTQGLRADYFGYKVWSHSWFDNFVASVAAQSESAPLVRSEDQSRIAVATLSQTLIFGRFGQASAIKITEASPAEVSVTTTPNEKATFKHLGLVGVSLDQMQHRLLRYDVPFEPFSNPDRNGLIIEFGPDRELVVADRPLTFNQAGIS